MARGSQVRSEKIKDERRRQILSAAVTIFAYQGLSAAKISDVAEAAGLDLVEISPQATPPVCRIMDFGKYKYELSKKDHQSRRHQKSTQVKEIKLRPRTDKHDLEIKIRQIKGFLEEGNKTKVTLTYRGREMANQEMGRTLMNSVIAELVEAGTIEYAPRMEGRSLIMIVAPKA